MEKFLTFQRFQIYLGAGWSHWPSEFLCRQSQADGGATALTVPQVLWGEVGADTHLFTKEFMEDYVSLEGHLSLYPKTSGFYFRTQKHYSWPVAPLKGANCSAQVTFGEGSGAKLRARLLCAALLSPAWVVRPTRAGSCPHSRLLAPYTITIYKMGKAFFTLANTHAETVGYERTLHLKQRDVLGCMKGSRSAPVPRG